MNETGERGAKLSKFEAGPPNKEAPWEDDVLARQELGRQVSTLISTLHQPFTISISGEYGSGKSFFLQRLNCDLRKDGYLTAFFNAWEADYSEDPLAAFISVIRHDLEGMSIGGKVKS